MFDSKEPQRLCGLITDFGHRDYFVGTLKGVMKGIYPDVEVIDICHDIPSYSLLPASFAVEKNYQYFPPGTIFLVVVDPGVGSDRNILLVRHFNRFFIAPDNGVLTPILVKNNVQVGVLNNERYFLSSSPSTFEARDKMAPATAFLASGVDPDEMATPTQDFVVDMDYYPKKSKKIIKARVVYIDKFGNIMTNVSEDILSSVMVEFRLAHFRVEFNDRVIKDLHENYAAADREPFLIMGSHHNLEIAIFKGSAALALNARIGQEILIHFY